MFKNKKILKIVILSLISIQATTIFAADYDKHWAKVEIERWQQIGILKGYPDGSFKPNQFVTRAELAHIASESFGLSDTWGAKTYTDVQQTAWYAQDIAKISSMQLMNDQQNTFRPNDVATREEAAYLMANLYSLLDDATIDLDFKDKAQIADWAQPQVAALNKNGYITGKPGQLFAPQGKLTRAEVIKMLDNLTPNYIKESGTYTEAVTGNLVVKSKGVVLKNMTITGNLYLTQGIGTGNVILENVTVVGKIYIGGKFVDSTTIEQLQTKPAGGSNTESIPTQTNNVEGSIRVNQQIVTAQKQGNRIIFDLSELDGDARVQDLKLSSTQVGSINLEGVENSFVTNKYYKLTEIISKMDTQKIKDQTGLNLSDEIIKNYQKIISKMEDMSIDTIRQAQAFIGELSYEGTVKDANGNIQTITVQIKVN